MSTPGARSEIAEKKGVTLLLENMNPEPTQAEVHYLGTISRNATSLRSTEVAALRWSYTVNHAHILPIGIKQFHGRYGHDPLRRGAARRLPRQVEEHLRPGEGTIDFPEVFALIEASGYQGHYMQAFGSLDDMIAGRETLAALAEQGIGKS